MQYDRSLTATVYIVHDNCVLLHMHKKYKTWFPVGGHVEPDEFPYQAAIREAKEESGLNIELLVTEMAPDFDAGHVVRIPMPFCTFQCGSDEIFYDFNYIATTDNTVLLPGKNESTEFRWFDRQALSDSTEVKIHIKNTALAVLDYVDIQNSKT